MLGGDYSQEAWASGLLAGAGLREISQNLGRAKKRQGEQGQGPAGAMPTASTMLQGNMGDIDRVMLLSRLQSAMGKPPMPGLPQPGGPVPGAGPMPGPGIPPPGLGAPPMPGGPMLPPP